MNVLLSVRNSASQTPSIHTRFRHVIPHTCSAHSLEHMTTLIPFIQD